jgi:hypothetical protein
VYVFVLLLDGPVVDLVLLHLVDSSLCSCLSQKDHSFWGELLAMGVECVEHSARGGGSLGQEAVDGVVDSLRLDGLQQG